jgi:hypothetical protein
VQYLYNSILLKIVNLNFSWLEVIENWVANKKTSRFFVYFSDNSILTQSDVSKLDKILGLIVKLPYCLGKIAHQCARAI